MRKPAATREAEIERWVSEIRDGIDVEANSRRIFDHYYEWLRGFFSRRGFPPRETEDLAQETLIHVFHRLSSFRRQSTFTSWLFAIAANTARNYRRGRETLKRAGREVSLESSKQEESSRFLEIADDSEPPDREVFAKERLQALGEAVDALPPQMRRCFLLRYERDLKYREIATLLKINIQTVKVHLFNARQRLAVSIEQSGRPRVSGTREASS